jgi:phosphocarrier protein HPr
MINTGKGSFKVKNDRGLHTRPSTEIVRLATSFKAEIRLRYHKVEVNAKSLLGILMLSAVKGSKIKVIAHGKDAMEAVEALLDLAECNFNIHY